MSIHSLISPLYWAASVDDGSSSGSGSASGSAGGADAGVFGHTSVLLDGVISLVRAVRPRRIVDCTVGGAGHARALLDACPDAELFGLDRDPRAAGIARERLAPYGRRARVVQARFSELTEVLSKEQWLPVDALIADLGVSSPQLDEPERGFSFRHSGPLDMRMNPEEGRTAAEIIASLDATELADAIYQLGEERHSRRVARAIVESKPETTQALAALVRRLVPKSADGLDPATRTFQALRMLVNDELGELNRLLEQAPGVLADNGIALVISFHSLEDRAVKTAFRQASRDCICPPGLPVCMCGHVATMELITRKSVRPSTLEVRDNPRARSAKLRAARRLPRA